MSAITFLTTGPGVVGERCKPRLRHRRVSLAGRRARSAPPERCVRACVRSRSCGWRIARRAWLVSRRAEGGERSPVGERGRRGAGGERGRGGAGGERGRGGAGGEGGGRPGRGGARSTRRKLKGCCWAEAVSRQTWCGVRRYSSSASEASGPPAAPLPRCARPPLAGASGSLQGSGEGNAIPLALEEAASGEDVSVGPTTNLLLSRSAAGPPSEPSPAESEARVA